MNTNPRIDELRKRLEKEPGSRLFAQLAEELRKGGDLADAVRVARDGLGKHPGYASARMTLGRALLDQGDVSGAKVEFEEVLKGAPDNILARRFLGECLEAEGDLAGALARYNQTLLLSPGDAGVVARRRVVEEHLAEASRVATVRTVGETPIPVSEAEEEMEVQVGHAAHTDLIPAGIAAPTSAAEAPIPLSKVEEEEFELERAHEAPVAGWAGEASEPKAGPGGEAVFEFEEAQAELEGALDTAVTESPEVEHGRDGDLTSPTLAELYFSQGFPDRALEVYRRLLAGDPGNERLQARVAEIENLQRKADSGSSAATVTTDPRAARRVAVERSIVRLERFLAAARREAR